MEYILFGILIILIFGGFWLILRSLKGKNESKIDLVALKERIETSNSIWTEQFKGIREEITKSRREELDIRDKSTKDIHTQVEKFIEGFSQMGGALKQIQEEVKEVSSFQNIFRSPKLTGQWGEASLEYLLSQYFPRQDSYELQYPFPSGEKVDAILKLPNGRVLPIDSKFPQDIFNQFIKAPDNSIEKEEARKLLILRIKKDIDDISTKYILPNEGTVDLAMMYIPAESLYYEIVTKEDLNSYAWKKKITLASPNTFILNLAIIQHWFKDADIGKKTDLILKKLQRVTIDGTKLSESFQKLGAHLSNAKNSFEDSEKRLNFLTDRVNDVSNLLEENEEAKKLPEKV